MFFSFFLTKKNIATRFFSALCAPFFIHFTCEFSDFSVCRKVLLHTIVLSDNGNSKQATTTPQKSRALRRSSTIHSRFYSIRENNVSNSIKKNTTSDEEETNLYMWALRCFVVACLLPPNASLNFFFALSLYFTYSFVVVVEHTKISVVVVGKKKLFFMIFYSNFPYFKIKKKIWKFSVE